MQNVTMKVEGRELVLRINLDADLGPSKSGKTTVIATTNGNQPIPGCPVATFIGVNVYRRKV
jgi:hypothetical protein